MTRRPRVRCIHGRMPRPPRFILPGHTLHLVQRGNNRTTCFVDDEDRLRYLTALLHASERARCAIHAYALMTNHVHLLATADDALAPSRMMQSLGRTYVRNGSVVALQIQPGTVTALVSGSEVYKLQVDSDPLPASRSSLS